jgi:hypothetical protein
MDTLRAKGRGGGASLSTLFFASLVSKANVILQDREELRRHCNSLPTLIVQKESIRYQTNIALPAASRYKVKVVFSAPMNCANHAKNTNPLYKALLHLICVQCVQCLA